MKSRENAEHAEITEHMEEVNDLLTLFCVFHYFRVFRVLLVAIERKLGHVAAGLLRVRIAECAKDAVACRFSRRFVARQLGDTGEEMKRLPYAMPAISGLAHPAQQRHASQDRIDVFGERDFGRGAGASLGSKRAITL